MAFILPARWRIAQLRVEASQGQLRKGLRRGTGRKAGLHDLPVHRSGRALGECWAHFPE